MRDVFEAMKEIVKPAEELTCCDQMELVMKFRCLEDRLNASDGCEAAVTATRDG